MRVTDRIFACIACLSLCAPALLSALELGPIDVRSPRYAPLDAQIPLHDLRDGDAEGLTVALGTPDQFELAGVARSSPLDLLDFSVVRPREGGSYVQVRTSEPIVEPSLTFLVEVGWPRGRTVRTYRLQFLPAASPSAESSARTGTTRDPEPGTTDSGTASVPALPAAEPAAYGPVRRTDTLWSIAGRVRPHRSVSVHRMMLALLEANPEAFAARNVNALYAGAILQIPSREEIGADEHAAVAEVRRQQAQWEGRGASRRASPPASAGAPAAPGAEPVPGGRIELVSPETTGGAAARDGDAAARADRRELALAREENDALRQQNAELERRLAEAESHIRELGRLVELKDREIASLNAALNAEAEAAAPPAHVESQPRPVSAQVEADPAPQSPDAAAPQSPDAAAPPGPAPVEIASLRRPEPAEPAELEVAIDSAPEEVEAEPPAVSSQPEPTPIPVAAEEEPEPTPAVVEPAQDPTGARAQGISEPASADTEGRSLPFDLAAAVGNPAYLASGAGTLLTVLGVAALVRRRRASAAAGAAPEVMGGAGELRTDEDDVLVELEALTADLADEPVASPERRPPGISASRQAGPATAARADGVVSSSDFDIDGEPRIADLWRRRPETGPDSLSALETDRASALIELRLAEREDGSDDSGSLDDETSDNLVMSDLDDLADGGANETTEAEDGNAGDLGLLFRDDDDTGTGSEAREPAPTSGDEARSDSGGRKESPPAARQDDLVPPASGTPAAARANVRGETGAAARGRLRRQQGAGDGPGEAAPTVPPLPEDLPPGDDTEGVSIADLGDDEMQTKTDLAQLYAEMGDTDRAREFLETVLAEGNAGQRETAREMLARLA